jgi:hypothetical protein
MEPAKIYRLDQEHSATTPAATSFSPQKPKLRDQVPQAIRTPQYSYITEKAHVGWWIKRCILFRPSRAVLAGYCCAGQVPHADPGERSTPIAVLSKK